MKLLIVEDHDVLATAIDKTFSAEGYAVDCVGRCDDAVNAAKSFDYDAVILDRGLPDGDGLEFLKTLRSNGQGMPVLLLTAKGDVHARIEGLDAGADDYVVKPVELEELLARVRALMRRPRQTTHAQLSLGNVKFDINSRDVSVAGRSVSVSRRETGVLRLLLERANRTVPKDTLRDRLYGFDDDVTSNSIEVHISRLRRHLSDAGANVRIVTKRGVGYQLTEV